MKKAFFQLAQEKRDKILSACLGEFSAHEFDKAGLDRIVEAAGISKGGLYEYIDSKSELYLYVIEYAYASLYEYLRSNVSPGDAFPADILDRFRAVSGAAINFYIAKPELIGIITKTTYLSNLDLIEKVNEIFKAQFSSVFDNTEDSRLRFPRDLVMDLLKWLLIKTRNDFLAQSADSGKTEEIKKKYLAEWDFILSVLEKGIYRE